MILWAILATVVSFAFSWWAYNYLKSVNTSTKYALIVLRGLALSIIAVVLLNPSFSSEVTQRNKKNVGLMLDATESVSVSRGIYDGLESYGKVLESLSKIDTTNLNVIPFYFSSSITDASLKLPESLASSTNLESSVISLIDRMPSLDGIIVATDGVYNDGQDPSYTIQDNVSIPIFTIGLSDTNKVRDLYVSSIDVPSTMFLNAVVPIESKIMQSGYNGKTVGVSLYVNGKSIQNKRYKFRGDQTERTVRFEYQPKSVGNVELEVRLEILSDEFNQANNRMKKYASIAEDKVRILFLAYGIHPDIKSINQSFSVQENVFVYPKYYAGAGKYLKERNLSINTDTLEAIIVFGLPLDNSTELNRLKNWTSEVPTFWIMAPDINPTQYSRFSVPLDFGRFSGVRNARISVKESAIDHPIFDSSEGESFNYSFPAIKTPYYPGSPKVGAEVLLEAEVGNDPKNPILVLGEMGNSKTAFFGAFDFYLLTQNSDKKVRDSFGQLLRNVVKWLTTRNDTRLLRINHQFPDVSKPGMLVFNAELFNEAGDRESKGRIQLDLNSADGSQKFALQNLGGGKYSVNCGLLPEGRYSYSAVASVGDREIDKTTGELSVSIPKMEFLETKQNRALLERIAAITNGTFLNFDDADNLSNILSDRGFYTENITTMEQDRFLFSSPWWFLLAITFLAAEWFIRKKIALP